MTQIENPHLFVDQSKQLWLPHKMRSIFDLWNQLPCHLEILLVRIHQLIYCNPETNAYCLSGMLFKINALSTNVFFCTYSSVLKIEVKNISLSFFRIVEVHEGIVDVPSHTI